jgi:uncharacterized protein (TIGR02118 family)
MSEQYTRRVTLGMLAAAFGAGISKGVRAAARPKDVSRPGISSLTARSHAMTILYPAGDGIKFDPDYYRDHHLKLIMRLYGSSIKRFELRTAAAESKFSAAVNIWIADFDAFNENNTKHGPELVADVHNFTNSQPSIQFDQVHGMMGAPASAMKIGATCLTILYPNSEGVRWDVEYYRTHHMPLIMGLYGNDAIKRFELRKGASDQKGGSPPYIGAVNIYINDQKAFDAAGSRHGKTLVADVPHFSSVMPVAFPTTVHGIG